MQDSFFARYVDEGRLIEAWESLDTGRLIDAAMELEDAERRFQRSHTSGIRAEDLLLLAAELAQGFGQKDQLERVGTIAKAIGSSDLDKAVAKALAHAKDNPINTYAVQLNAEELESFREAANRLAKARLAGDSERLKQARASIPPSLPREAIQDLERMSGGGADETAAGVTSAASALTRMIANPNASHLRQLREIVYVDLEGRQGQFSVRANDSIGVRARNGPSRVKRVRLTAAGSWSFAPGQLVGPNGGSLIAPPYSRGQNYWLPGYPVGGLLAWGGVDVPRVQWMGSGPLEVQLNPGGQVLFICNDNSVRTNGVHAFSDNQGEVTVSWQDIPPVIG